VLRVETDFANKIGAANTAIDSSAIRPSSFPICFSFNSPPLDSTASRKSWCAHRVVSKHTLSDRIFRVFYGPRGSKPKTGLQIDLKAHLLSSGTFFSSLFYGEDDPEVLTLNYVNAGYKRPCEKQGGRRCDLG
jgi:hypothetical protein